MRTAGRSTSLQAFWLATPLRMTQLSGDLESRVKPLKVTGILWGLIYLVTGYIKAWTFNGNDSFDAAAVLLALFVLPLPITLMAVWFSKLAGRSLLLCVAIYFIAATTFAIRKATSFTSYTVLLIYLTAYSFPHLFFGIAYLRSAREMGSNSIDNEKPFSRLS